MKEGQNRGVDSEPEDLWFFLDDYCIKVRGIETKKNTEKLELIPLKGKVQNVCIVEQNCRPPEGAGPTPAPQITVTIKREGIEDIELKAAQPANCNALLRIFKSYLTPLSSDLGR